jgi:hypothetical protein
MMNINHQDRQTFPFVGAGFIRPAIDRMDGTDGGFVRSIAGRINPAPTDGYRMAISRFIFTTSV